MKGTIKSTLNPFAKEINKDALFNIKTGRQASDSVEKYLLNFSKVGIEERDKFVKECNEDPQRFEKPMQDCELCYRKL